MIILKDARHVIAAAEARAHEIGQPVVDAGGQSGEPCPDGRRMDRQHRHLHQ